MNSLNPTSVAVAGSIMARWLGYDWAQDRLEVVNGVNRFRNHLYNRGRNMFDDVFHCFTPQDFPLECVGTKRCNNCYKGATLPADMAGVVKAWNCGTPLRVRSRWRESFTGRVPCASEMSLVVLPQRFPTEREFRAATRLRFFAENSADVGKTVFMEAKMRSGVQRLKFALRSDEWVESVDPVHQIISITLPDGLKGCVTLATEDNTELSVYAPWERVPSYTRVKFLQPCPSNVFIQGTRAYSPIYFDPDIVEVGDPVIMEFYAQYIRYNKSRDGKDRETGNAALQNANRELDGLISRYLGRALQDGPSRSVKVSRVLPGYGRSNGVAVVSAGGSRDIGVSFAGNCSPTVKPLYCVQGDRGKPGVAGEQGPMGSTGATGSTGPAGPGAEQEVITDVNGNRWLKVNDNGTFRYSQLFDEIPV